MKKSMGFPLGKRNIIIAALLLSLVLLSCTPSKKKTESDDTGLLGSDTLAKKITNVDLWLNGQIEDFVTISYGGVCKDCVPPEAKIVTVYMVFKKDMNAPLVMKAFDKNDNEIGRTEIIAAGSLDDAKYIDFIFDLRTPLSELAYCSIQFKKLENK